MATIKLIAYVALQQFCEHDDTPRRLLDDAGFEVRLNTLGRRLTAEDLRRVLPDVDGVLAGVEPYDAALLATLPRLRCISRCGLGTDTIDLDAARRQSITVCTTVEEVVEPVAEMTVAMILALARQFVVHHDTARAGQWIKRTGAMLREWRIGLIGFGRIGRTVERMLRPFQPTMLVHDPALQPSDLPGGVAWRPLDALLQEADLVSLHASRSSSDGPLLGAAQFARMKPGARVVNTARGYLIDESALHDALTSKRLSGAALDVFEREPYTGPLAQLPNVLCTPHVSSLTVSSRTAMERGCAQNLIDCFRRNAAPRLAGAAGARP